MLVLNFIKLSRTQFFYFKLLLVVEQNLRKLFSLYLNS